MPEREALAGGSLRGALAGMRVVVTRPAGPGEDLARCLEAEGAQVMRFPTLEIAGIGDPGPALRLIDRLEQFELAMFVSANAVSHGLATVRSRRAWPERLRNVAVGPGTAAALREAGLEVHLQPSEQFDTEGVLALADLGSKSVAGSQIVIFRGRGGLSDLGDALRARGARVEYAEVYERRLPHADPRKLREAGRRGAIDSIVVTSGAALRNLFLLIGEPDREWLVQVTLVVASERLAEIALQLGLARAPVIARGASDARILEALLQWRKQEERGDGR